MRFWAYTSSTTEDGKDKWDQYPGINKSKLSLPFLVKLNELYDIWRVIKKQKVGSKRDHNILLNKIITSFWE